MWWTNIYFLVLEILLHSKEVVELISEWSVTLVSFDHVFQNQFYFNWKEKILKEVKSQLKSKEVEQLENEICESLDANLKVNFNYLDLDGEVMIGVIYLLLAVSKQDVQVNHYLTSESTLRIILMQYLRKRCRNWE